MEEMLATQTKGQVLVYLNSSWTTIQLSPTLPSDPVENEENVDGGGGDGGDNWLDVDLLNTLLLNPILRIGDLKTDPRIHFVGGKGGYEILQQDVDANYPSGVAFKMFPVTIQSIISVSDREALMPPKVTKFKDLYLTYFPISGNVV